MGGIRSLGRCVAVLWTCLIASGMLRAETIHFTNSPKLIMASKNFTTYEIEVPGSKPITIIEATDPYHGPEPDQTFPTEVRIPGSSKTTSFRTSTGLSVSRPTDGVENTGTVRKTLYSPELLDKFLREYSEKLRNADSATRKRLNEITMINSVNQNANADERGPENQYRNKQPPRDAIEGDSDSSTSSSSSSSSNSSGDDADADGDSASEDEPKTEDEFVFNDTHERHVMAAGIKRWYQQEGPTGGYNNKPVAPHPVDGGGHKAHPWNIKDGWVTLEAVPWSESKVSKWHANGGPVSEVNKNHNPPVKKPADRYWNAGLVSSEDTPKYKPVATSGSIGASSYYHGEPDDDYGYGGAHGDSRLPVNRLPTATPPPEPLYNRRRPTVSLYSERPDADQSRLPASPQQPQPSDSWYELHSSSPYDAMKAYNDPGPGSTSTTVNRDIITDGRPANFPKYTPEHTAANGYDTNVSPAESNQRIRPGSYPERGNGEWVLISTTKGYQYPKRRQGQRAITFSPATSTSHQSVKLTVLPMKNAIDMTTSHNGLIEVSSSTQTVEDAVKQQQKNKRKGAYPGPTTVSSLLGHRKKKHPPKTTAAQTFSLMRRDAAQDSSAVLAAVGAGMVPATMAILAPMVLGKKRK